MKNRHLAITGLTLVAALGLAGCGTTSEKATSVTPSAAASAPATDTGTGAEAELVAAAAKLGQDTVKVDMAMGGAMSMTGMLDPRSGKADMAMALGAGTTETKVQLRQLKNDMYMKFEGSLAKSVGGTWMHLDAAKLKDGSSFNLLQGNDPAGTQAMVKAMTNVQKNGAHAFKGVLDMTKTPRFDKDSMKALGAKASTVPFTATSDDQGRLIEMNIEMGQIMAGAGTMRMKYSDFGTAVNVTAPPKSQVKELPASMSSLLNA
jgi:uncharacterized lipoprotein YmbA